MKLGNATLAIYPTKNGVISHRAVIEYNHEGEVWIEGRSGSEFIIRIANNSNIKKLFIISVDGLSVFDGKLASSDSSGIILAAGETLDIPGWKTTDSTAAKFFFVKKEGSYSSWSGGNSENAGVIGVMVFDEKPSNMIPFPFNGNNYPLNDISFNNQTILRSAASQATCSSNKTDQELGTGFGSVTEFYTQQISFDRNELSKITGVMYYDSAKNLEAMGIDLKKVPSKPNPFPGEKGLVH